jgi:NAD(P)-dependent dehydrogenase (short-subunit alcohol dehydrogenase family)
MKSSEESHPLKRIGDAKEIAQIVTLLLSDAASFITGQIIKVDGGISSIKLI